ncbi:hypothetical protein [Poseidonocella sp. HB161398]|uniref:hypothetical protein n=1 Tax=Poseidonocella sp. HB161398 TaxID=2320855 RepID=UPI0011089FB9|nr:hypothetical protein [Poseidonocella sp. HB161398]
MTTFNQDAANADLSRRIAAFAGALLLAALLMAAAQDGRPAAGAMPGWSGEAANGVTSGRNDAGRRSARPAERVELAGMLIGSGRKRVR